MMIIITGTTKHVLLNEIHAKTTFSIYLSKICLTHT